MPTLFERLDQALEGNELDGRLAAQVGSLTAIVDVVSGLIANPPDELGDLQAAISELPLPDLQLGGEFSGTLDAIREALPSDLSSVTGDLLNGLQQLQTTVGTQLTQVLQDTLEVVLEQVDAGALKPEDFGRLESVTPKTFTSPNLRRLAQAAAGRHPGERIMVYQRADGSLAPVEVYAGDEDRAYLKRRLYDMALRFRPLFEDQAEFDRLFPKPTVKPGRPEPAEQLRLF